MKIAYCDDEAAQAVFLRDLTNQWELAGYGHCDITVYSSAEQMLFENPDSFPFDFIILDIELDRMNGIDLARSIRKSDKNVMIAFLSNSREYVFDGYEVQAVRYLMKPISAKQLFPLLDMVQKVAKTDKQYIIVDSAGEKIKLEQEKILFVEACGHYINIHTERQTPSSEMKVFNTEGKTFGIDRQSSATEHQTFEVKMNFNDIAEMLRNDFIETHRSYLVNLRYIERITKTDCILKGGLQIPISRNSYKNVNQAFIRYYKGGSL